MWEWTGRSRSLQSRRIWCENIFGRLLTNSCPLEPWTFLLCHQNIKKLQDTYHLTVNLPEDLISKVLNIVTRQLIFNLILYVLYETILYQLGVKTNNIILLKIFSIYRKIQKGKLEWKLFIPLEHYANLNPIAITTKVTEELFINGVLLNF